MLFRLYSCSGVFLPMLFGLLKYYFLFLKLVYLISILILNNTILQKASGNKVRQGGLVIQPNMYANTSVSYPQVYPGVSTISLPPPSYPSVYPTANPYGPQYNQPMNI